MVILIFRFFLKKDGTLSEYINIGYGFHISLSIVDLPLLKKIQLLAFGLAMPISDNEKKKVGHIYSYPKKDEVRFALTKKKLN